MLQRYKKKEYNLALWLFFVSSQKRINTKVKYNSFDL